MKNIIIRKAKIKDLDKLIGLFLELCEYMTEIDPSYRLSKNKKGVVLKYLRRFIYVGYRNIFVAEKDGELVGFMTAMVVKNSPLFLEKNFGLISEAYVIEKMRKKNINHLMLEATLDWFKKQNIKRIELNVLPGNKLGMKVWEKEGFADVLLRKRKMLK